LILRAKVGLAKFDSQKNPEQNERYQFGNNQPAGGGFRKSDKKKSGFGRQGGVHGLAAYLALN